MPGGAIRSSSAIRATYAASASSPSPVSAMTPQSSPEVWLSRSITVTSGRAGSGTYRPTGASRSTRPSATRHISVVAVTVFVTDPSRWSVCPSTGNGLSTLVTPWHAWISRPPAHTPTDAPGMPKSVAVALTYSNSVMPPWSNPDPASRSSPHQRTADEERP